MPIATFDPGTGAYTDEIVARGFPLGGIGAGSLCLNADGSFGEVRCHNNWMAPIPAPRGSFLALFAHRGDVARTVLVRRPRADDEYEGVVLVGGTRFVGELPQFTLRVDDDGLPLDVTVAGFTPHVPHEIRDSTLP